MQQQLHATAWLSIRGLRITLYTPPPPKKKTRSISHSLHCTHSHFTTPALARPGFRAWSNFLRFCLATGKQIPNRRVNRRLKIAGLNKLCDLICMITAAPRIIDDEDDVDDADNNNDDDNVLPRDVIGNISGKREIKYHFDIRSPIFRYNQSMYDIANRWCHNWFRISNIEWRIYRKLS